MRGLCNSTYSWFIIESVDLRGIMIGYLEGEKNEFSFIPYENSPIHIILRALV